MNELNIDDVTAYVESNIGTFHRARSESLSRVSLEKILKRKNLYLFRAKNILTSENLVTTILDSHLSSQEETMFGDFLEGLAIFICGKVYGGFKSAAEGIDLEFYKDGVHCLVTIKSGPNWGNSGQIREMKANFRKATQILRTSRSGINVIAVNGCCYGKGDRPEKEEYLKLYGQRFWTFISGSESLYTDIIEPVGHRAKEKNEEFAQSRAQIINRFTREFSEKFCDESGQINWQEILRLNSQARTQKAT